MARHLSARLCPLLMIAGVALSGIVTGARPPRTPDPFAISADAATLKLLAAARAWIGPDTLIRDVSGFTVTSIDHHPSMRARFPDQFRVDHEVAVHVLDGTHYWLLQRPRGGAAVRTPDPGDGRKERVLRRFAATSLNLLLRAPDGAPVQARRVGRVVLKDLSGEAVRFQFADGAIVHDLVLDPATSRPRGTAVADRRSSGEAYTAVQRFLEFRTVGGLTIPSRLHEEWVPTETPLGPWPGESTYDIGMVVFHPPPSAADFKYPLPK
jgi:hypothetical protein